MLRFSKTSRLVLEPKCCFAVVSDREWGAVKVRPALLRAPLEPTSDPDYTGTMIRISDKIALSEQEIHLDFVRASGPGGQKVNKTATAVKLRFDAAHSPSLPDDVRQRLIDLAGRRVSGEGVIIIDARRFRTQERNRADAMNRLIELIRRAARRPRPRRRTRPSLASKRRRLAAKRRRSETKRLRRPPTPFAE